MCYFVFTLSSWWSCPMTEFQVTGQVGILIRGSLIPLIPTDLAKSLLSLVWRGKIHATKTRNPTNPYRLALPRRGSVVLWNIEISDLKSYSSPRHHWSQVSPVLFPGLWGRASVSVTLTSHTGLSELPQGNWKTQPMRWKGWPVTGFLRTSEASWCCLIDLLLEEEDCDLEVLCHRPTGDSFAAELMQ